MNIEVEEKERKKFAEQLQVSKYDLDDILYKLTTIRQSYYEKGTSQEEEKKFPKHLYTTGHLGSKNFELQFEQNVYSDLITIVDSMSPALLAPFHHYNNYIDYWSKDFLWDDIKYSISPDELRDSNTLRRTKYQIEVQSLLISIKMGLDRLVGFLSYYYKGISSHTTFGRQKENGSYRGFMATVQSNKLEDSLCEYIYSQYESWIKVVVEPRDLVIHYNDLGLYYEFDKNLGISVPNHFNERLIKDKSDNSTTYNYSYKHLKQFTDFWIEFIEQVFSELLKKEIANYRVKI